MASLKPNEPSSVDIPAGAGPRHLVLHKTGKYAYLINELIQQSSHFNIIGKRGKFCEIQTKWTLPEKFVGENTCVSYEICPTASKIVGLCMGLTDGHDSYGFMLSIRNDRIILFFCVGHASTYGKSPRHFTIIRKVTLSGIRQDSDSVVTFRIDNNTGELHASWVKSQRTNSSLHKNSIGNICQLATLSICVKEN